MSAMRSGGDRTYWLKALLLVMIWSGVLWAQQSLPDAPQPQNNAPDTQAPLPEAPSASRSTPPPATTPPPPSTTKPPSTPATSPSSAPPGSPPADGVGTLPPGSVPNVPESPRDQLFTLTKNVNFVLVPVTVKDMSGHLVEGLLKNDFSVYEDGNRQNITFFTSDPFPLSAAVVLDLGLPDSVWRKVKDTLPALVGSFSQFDEVALFTYGNTVQKVQDFTGVDATTLAASLRKIRNQTGKMGGAPVVGGPMTGGPSPSVNGRPLDPNVPHVATYPRESSVLNDAILAAATELSKRGPARRKILFVVSDGREVGSANTYNDVLKVLLTRQVIVYAVGVGGGGLPGYRQLEKIRIPGQGYGDILPKYASATGGQVFPEVNQQAIEAAYARVTEEARNQYSIGYTTRATPSSTYRSIEVRVDRPSLRIYARDGYYPLPPGR